MGTRLRFKGDSDIPYNGASGKASNFSIDQVGRSTHGCEAFIPEHVGFAGFSGLGASLWDSEN